ncbi:MAG: hypothetical protein ACOVKO_10010 [Elstera sp.]
MNARFRPGGDFEPQGPIDGITPDNFPARAQAFCKAKNRAWSFTNRPERASPGGELLKGPHSLELGAWRAYFSARDMAARALGMDRALKAFGVWTGPARFPWDFDAEWPERHTPPYPVAVAEGGGATRPATERRSFIRKNWRSVP